MNPRPSGSLAALLTLPALAAFLAIIGLRANAPATADKTNAAAESNEPKPTELTESNSCEGPAEPYLLPLANFLDLPHDCPPNDVALEVDIKTELQKRRAGNPNWRDRFLIVMAPDPDTPGSDFLTDAVLESIRRAVETPQYINGVLEPGPVLDRYYLPWRHDNDVANVRSTSDFGNGSPGLLVFREMRKVQSGCIVVLVVPDHPALGLDRKAADEALRVAGELEADESAPICVLGPSFSGSQASLAAAFKRYSERERPDSIPTPQTPPAEATDADSSATPSPTLPIKFRVICGSATSIDAEQLCAESRPADVCFRTTTIPDEALRSALLYYLAGEPCGHEPTSFKKQDLRSSLRPLGKIAFLVESDTGYGQNNARTVEPLQTNDLEVTTIPFPLHVSEVLVAYQSSRQSQSNNLPRLESLGGKIDLPLTNDRLPTERFHALTPGWTTVRVDMLLRQITKTLRERRYEYVGILATSTKDKLFLASLIRRACPDIRLFTTVSDVLLAHPAVAQDLTGMVVASTYPLYWGNQDWSADNSPALRTAFGHQSAQGVYNAALALLGNTEMMLEYRPPLVRSTATTCERSNGKEPILPAATEREPYPAIWISVVGRDDVYPLTSYRFNEATIAAMQPAPGKTDPARNEAIRAAQESRPSALVKYMYHRPPAKVVDRASEPADPQTHALWLVSFVVFTVLSTYVVVKTILPLDCWPSVPQGLINLSVLLALGACWGHGEVVLFPNTSSIVARLVYVVCRLVEIELLGGVLVTFYEWIVVKRSGRLTAIAACFLTAILLSILAHWYWPFSARTGNAEYFIRVARAVSELGGVSPLAPVFCFTMAIVWVWFALMNYYSVFNGQDREYGPLPLSSCVTGPNSVAVNEFIDAASDLEGYSPRLGAGAGLRQFWKRPFGLLWGATLVAICWRWPRGIDGWGHALLCNVLFFVALSLLLFLLAAVWGLWHAVRDMLLATVHLPMAQAFDRVPEIVAKNATMHFGWLRSREPELFSLYHQMHYLGAAPDAPTANAFESNWRSLASFTIEWMKWLAQHYWPKRPVTAAFGDVGHDGQKAGQSEPTATPAGDERFRQAEVLLASVILCYVTEFLVHVRRFSLALLGGACLLIIGAWSYPFTPNTCLIVPAWILLLIVGYRFWRISTQLNRDEVLSRAANTEPNKTTWNADFISAVAVYLGPIAVLILFSFLGVPADLLTWLTKAFGK